MMKKHNQYENEQSVYYSVIFEDYTRNIFFGSGRIQQIGNIGVFKI